MSLIHVAAYVHVIEALLSWSYTVAMEDYPLERFQTRTGTDVPDGHTATPSSPSPPPPLPPTVPGPSDLSMTDYSSNFDPVATAREYLRTCFTPGGALVEHSGSLCSPPTLGHGHSGYPNSYSFYNNTGHHGDIYGCHRNTGWHRHGDGHGYHRHCNSCHSNYTDLGLTGDSASSISHASTSRTTDSNPTRP